LAVAGDYLLAGTYENSIIVWNLKTYEIFKTLNDHQGCVLSLTVQGQFFFSGSYDTTIKVTKKTLPLIIFFLKVYNLDTLHVVDTLHHQAKVEALVATDKYIISGGTDNTIKIWSWKKRPVQQ
jgi:WD40 repeat protein